MGRFLSINFLFLVASVGLFGECTNKMQEQFHRVVTTKDYNLSIVEPIYQNCSTPSSEVIYYIAKAKDFEREDNRASVLQNYYKALSTIEDNELNGFNDITLDIQNQIAYYQKENAISSEELDRGGYILTRGDIKLGTRDALLKHYEDIKGIPINFKTNSSKIQKGINKKQADEIGKLLSKKYKNKKVYIIGFTDTIGKASHNKKLSEQRAKSLKDYFAKNYHIKRENIKIDSFGEKSPICESGYKQKRGNEYFCTGKENYYKSRRVTIEVGE